MDKTSEHQPVTDESGLALRCSCGSWAMLYRNSLGQDADTEHANHVTRAGQCRVQYQPRNADPRGLYA